MTRALFFTVLGYLSGSVLFARVLAGLLGKDILGKSKDENPGVSNAFQYGGFLCGMGTLLGDLLKGFFPVWLFLRGPESGGAPALALALVAAAPVVGHAFPVYYGFRGGKGIAVSFGCLLGLLPDWQPFAFFAGSFLFFSLVVKVTPHFQRTIVSYLAALVLLALSSQPGEVVLGFFLISCVVCLRLHMSKEPREAMQMQFFNPKNRKEVLIWKF